VYSDCKFGLDCGTYGVFPPCVGPMGHWSAHSRRTRGVEPWVTGTQPFRLGTSDVGLGSLHWSLVVQLRRVWFCYNPLAMTMIYELCHSHLYGLRASNQTRVQGDWTPRKGELGRQARDVQRRLT